MKAGRSKPWPDVLEEFTGKRKIDPQALLDYFKPLEDWLDGFLTDNGIQAGWNSDLKEEYFG